MTEEEQTNELYINQTVAILCDGNNIERSIQELSGKSSTMVNFDTLIPRLLSERGLNRFIYFREGKNISSKLADRLYTNFYGSVVPCHKSADIPLSIKATQLASKVDTIIIMSGDSDYVELVRHVKAQGVRVEIAAVKETSARILLDEADFFHPIVRSDWFEYNSSKGNTRGRRIFSKNKKEDSKNKIDSKESNVKVSLKLPPKVAVKDETKSSVKSSSKAKTRSSSKK